ncbi:MAG TPA: hypothetical protein VM029_22690 [Opitutaceae bacterium]|nr:hypothetical protein [Opitutaceae bacterium]
MVQTTSATSLLKPAASNLVIGLGLIALGGAIAAAGIYVGETDDAPGAALIGLVVMIGSAAMGVRIARRKK